MNTVRSSYKDNTLNYEHIFQLMCFMLQPKKIVEFGILDGFSLNSFVKYTSSECDIYAYDIFDDFNGNHGSKTHLETLFQKYPNVRIEKGDFYKCHKLFDDECIDILHIDIANTGDVYKFAIDHYLPKIKKSGYMVLEGGSDERDHVWWMKKFDKPKISSVLSDLDPDMYCVIQPHPSLTIIKSKHTDT